MFVVRKGGLTEQEEIAGGRGSNSNLGAAAADAFTEEREREGADVTTHVNEKTRKECGRNQTRLITGFAELILKRRSISTPVM